LPDSHGQWPESPHGCDFSGWQQSQQGRGSLAPTLANATFSLQKNGHPTMVADSSRDKALRNMERLYYQEYAEIPTSTI
jgi:hypothetical protein